MFDCFYLTDKQVDACPYTIAISKANVQIRIVLQFQQSRSLHLGYTCYIYRVKSPSFTPWFKCKKKQSFQTDFSQELLHYMSLLFLKTSKLIASSTLSIVICPRMPLIWTSYQFLIHSYHIPHTETFYLVWLYSFVWSTL